MLQAMPCLYPFHITLRIHEIIFNIYVVHVPYAAQGMPVYACAAWWQRCVPCVHKIGLSGMSSR